MTNLLSEEAFAFGMGIDYNVVTKGAKIMLQTKECAFGMGLKRKGASLKGVISELREEAFVAGMEAIKYAVTKVVPTLLSGPGFVVGMELKGKERYAQWPNAQTML